MSNPCAAAIALALLAAPALAQAPPHHPGAWSGSRWWGRDSAHATIAVNLYVLRGDSTAHSYVLSHAYDANPLDSLVQGALWAWNPAAEGCASVMDSNFTLIPMGPLPFNPHSAGGSALPDGNVLAVGGDEHRATGLPYAAIFDRGSRTWTMTDSMSQRRFDPATLVLADGRVLVGGGSECFAITWFGGRVDGGPALLERLERIRWTRRGDAAPAFERTGAWPPARHGHALGVATPYGARLMFGGRDSTGALLGDTWALARVEDDFSEGYAWTALAPIGSPPARAEHAGIVVATSNPNFPSMWLHGGAGGSGPLDDLWRLRFESGAWRWTHLTPDSVDGGAPTARAGHAGAWAEASRAIVLFGGADGGGNVHDSLFVLSLANPRAAWKRPHVMPGPAPGPRHLHAVTRDAWARPRPDGRAWSRLFVFGGHDGANARNDLWALWVSPGGDTVEWAPIVPAGLPPSPRTQPSLSHHEIQDRLVVIGGDGPPPGEALAWSVGLGSSPAWTPLPVAGSLAGHAAFSEPLVWNAIVPEVWNPATGQWSALATAPRRLIILPFLFVDTTGRVFEAGPTTGAYRTFRLDPSVPLWEQVPADTTRLDGGSAIMYRPGQVMKSGNRFVYGSAQPDARWIDLSAAAPAWRPTVNDMSTGRTNHNLVVLPTGEVLASGGTLGPGDALPVQQPELWNPDVTGPGGRRGQWYGGEGPLTLATDPLVRTYHATALLLPDGRVLSVGGQAVPSHALRANVYCPPYLFQANGAPAIRPRLLEAPAQVGWNEEFTLGTPDSIARAVLIRPGAAQHGINQDQRWVPLERIGGSLPAPRFRAPADGGIAPPGDYLLFVLDTLRVPSVARWVRVGPPPTGSVPEVRSTGLRLEPPRPNPSRGEVALAFTLARAGDVTLDVHDLAGRRVRRLAQGRHAAGTHERRWDGRDARGVPVAAGVYFVRLTGGSGRDHRRLVRLDGNGAID